MRVEQHQIGEIDKALRGTSGLPHVDITVQSMQALLCKRIAIC